MLHKFFMSVFGFLTSIISSFFTATVTVIIQHNKNLIWNYCVQFIMRKWAQYVLDKYTKTRTEQSDVSITESYGWIDDHHVVPENNYGVIYIQRPNKVKVDYKDPPKISIFDGKDTAIYDKIENTWSLVDYQEIFYLYRDKIDVREFSDVSIHRNADGDGHTINLVDKDGTKLKFIFNKNYVLKKFVMTTSNNSQETSYDFSNTKKDVEFEKDMFAIPYQAIAMKR